jgi:hypothetical protein
MPEDQDVRAWTQSFGPPPPASGLNPPKSARIRGYQPSPDVGASGLPKPFLRLFRFLRAVPPEREVGRSNRPGRAPLSALHYPLNSSERGGELLRGCLHGSGDRDRKVPVAVQDVARAGHRQPDDAASPGRIPDHVALWRLLPLGFLGRANVQIQHVVRGVVVG